jgi:hypothetical protein
MTQLATPRPLVPSDLPPADRVLIRAITARAVAASRGPGTRPEQIAEQFWPRDRATHAFVTRAATTGATMGGSGWAIDLVATAVSSFIGSLSASAAGALIAAAPQFDLGRNGQITLPRATLTGTGLSAWTGEAQPIPVGAGQLTAPQLGPAKHLGLIEVISAELARVSPGDAEAIVGTLLKDSMAKQLDLAIFSATAGSSTQPAGILNGISAVTATTGGGLSAALGDVRLLADAVAAGGGGGMPMFFASCGRALTLLGYAPALAGRVFGSAFIAAATLIAVDPAAFASTVGSAPELTVSREALLHFEDTTPLQIATGAQGSGVLATPSRDLFQTDQIGIRAIFECAWVMRVPAVSFISAAMSW